MEEVSYRCTLQNVHTNAFQKFKYEKRKVDFNIDSHALSGHQNKVNLAKLEKISQNLPDYVPKKVNVTSTGYEVYQNGSRLKEFMWDSKSKLNEIHAFVNRHCASKLRPSVHVIGLLTAFATLYFSDLALKLDPKSLPAYKNPDQWLKGKVTWTQAKKEKYRATIK